MEQNAALAGVATRALVAKVFPEFPFVYRPADAQRPEAGGNLDFLDAHRVHVSRTRPATGEEVAMFLAFEGVREQLATLLLAKATELSVAENRVADFSALLDAALKWAPELGQVGNPDRLAYLRALERGEEFRTGPVGGEGVEQLPAGPIAEAADAFLADPSTGQRRTRPNRTQEEGK